MARRAIGGDIVSGINEELAARFATQFDQLVAAVGEEIKGKDEVIRHCLIALLSGGHVLLEDVPGTGKTSLARALANVLGFQWQRVQCTPDLLPSDITGVSIYHPRDESFIFHPGPAFTNILVADEINRATPRTQSALLEVMQEGTVTVDGAPRSVPKPFMVIATQNPHEMSGTYTLPEAQLDRFMMKLSMGYPSRDAETEMLELHGSTRNSRLPLLKPEDVLHFIESAAGIFVSRAATRYVVDLVQATRIHPDIRLGASPRAGLALLRAAQVLALSKGRNHVLPADIQYLASPVLLHRLAISPLIAGSNHNDVLSEVLDSVLISLEHTSHD